MLGPCLHRLFSMQTGNALHPARAMLRCRTQAKLPQITSWEVAEVLG